jgi:hypothetical protein
MQRGLGAFGFTQRDESVSVAAVEYSCDTCSKTFGTAKARNAHRVEVHRDEDGEPRVVRKPARLPDDCGPLPETFRAQILLTRAGGVVAVEGDVVAMVQFLEEAEASDVAQVVDVNPIADQAQEPIAKKMKKKKIRRSYQLWRKVSFLDLYDSMMAIGSSMPQQKVVLTTLAHELQISASTLRGWWDERVKTRVEWDRVKALRKGASGRAEGLKKTRIGLVVRRRPFFAQAEVVLAAEIRACRSANKSYRVAKILPRLRKIVEMQVQMVEGAELELLRKRLSSCSWSKDLLALFLRRNRLSSRSPTCIKTNSLATMIRQGRGWMRFLKDVLVDKDGYASLPLDTEFGRFPLDCRINKDEVPCPLGGSFRQVEETGSKACHVIRIAGHGDRIATVIVAVSASGKLLPFMLIFKGKGINVEKYEDVVGVHVSYQPKAWIDGMGELNYHRQVLLPYAQSLRAKYGPRAEFLLQHDNVSAHHDLAALVYLKQHCNGLSLNSPPDATVYIQAVDDTLGHLMRADALAFMDDELDGKEGEVWSAQRKRALTVSSFAKVFHQWTTEDRKIKMIRAACVRTGLAMSVAGLVSQDRLAAAAELLSKSAKEANAKMVPVRFPKDFPESVFDILHPSYEDFVPHTPFKLRGAAPPVPDGPYNPQVVAQLIAAHAEVVALRPAARTIRVAAAVAAGDLAAAVEDNEDDFDSFDSEELDGEVLYEPERPSGELFVDVHESDVLDEAVQFMSNLARRGCLEGCACEDVRNFRCLCAKKAGHCLESCLCVGCKLGPKRTDEEAARKRADMIDTGLAIGLNEGEDIVERVLSHEVEHESLFFEVKWVGSDQTTEQELDTLVDADGTMNEKLVEYAKTVKLDLKPYVKMVLEYMNMKAGSRS